MKKEVEAFKEVYSISVFCIKFHLVFLSLLFSSFAWVAGFVSCGNRSSCGKNMEGTRIKIR